MVSSNNRLERSDRATFAITAKDGQRDSGYIGALQEGLRHRDPKGVPSRSPLLTSNNKCKLPKVDPVILIRRGDQDLLTPKMMAVIFHLPHPQPTPIYKL